MPICFAMLEAGDDAVRQHSSRREIEAAWDSCNQKRRNGAQILNGKDLH